MKVRLLDKEISLENKIIDIHNLEIREKMRESDLERFYGEFSERLPDIEKQYMKQRSKCLQN